MGESVLGWVLVLVFRLIVFRKMRLIWMGSVVVRFLILWEII